MIGGVVSILVVQSIDLVSLIGSGIGRAANVAFLRLATLFLAQALDLATFTVMVTKHGVAAEANPLVSGLFLTQGLVAVVLAKGALVVLVGSLFVASWSHGRRGVWSIVGGIPLALGIAFGLIGGITNAAAYLH